MEKTEINSNHASHLHLPPGIDYTLSACRGKWAYLNDEGGNHVFRGYRIGLSFSQCLRSMFQIHNETMNVWTHLIGSILFIFLCFHVVGSPTFHPSNFVKSAFNPNPVVWNDEGSQCFLNSTQRIVQGSELFGWVQSNDGFSAAKGALNRLKGRLPNLKKWKYDLLAMANSMKESVELEANILRAAVAETAANVDRSLETIRHELSDLKSMSLEGCLVCWADMLQKLSKARQALLDQMDGLSEALKASHNSSRADNSRRSSNNGAPAAEADGVANTLNSGVAAVRQALGQASQKLRREVAQELAALETFQRELFARGAHAPPLARWPIVSFLGSAFVCLLMSAAYHLFNCHSRRLNDVLLLLDYSGISVLIAGSFIPTMYYGFYCDPHMRAFYMTAITLLSVVSLAVGLYSGLRPSAGWRLARVLAYSANAGFGIIPLLHMLALWQAGQPAWAPCFLYLTAMLALYGLGTVIYTLQFPERYFPHRFDLFLSSHQLWHLLVFSAALLHFFCTVGHFHWRLSHPCPAPPLVPL